MEILKQGQTPNLGLILTGECDYCNCKFRCVRAECTWDRTTPNEKGFSKIKCPYCSIWVYPVEEKAV